MNKKPIIAQDGMELLHEDGDVLTNARVGDIVEDFRGDVWELTGGAPPRHAGSTGRVWVKNAAGQTGEYYPSVFNCVWVDAVR